MNYQESYYDEEIDISKEIPETSQAQKFTLKHQDMNYDHKSDKNDESLGSDSDLSKSEEIKEFSNSKFVDAEKWKNLNVSQEIKECFQYIAKYAPQNIDIEYTLQPFIPDYVPAVGDVDAFLKVLCPDTFDTIKRERMNDMVKNLGLIVLDEPSGHQSEPSLLNMRLKSVLTNTNVTQEIQTPIAKSERDIQKWITEIEQLHIEQSRKTNNTNSILNDIQHISMNSTIDTLMAEWPENFEQQLRHIGFPFYNIDCSLDFYIKLICALFDIPILENSQYHFVIAIHTLFNLFLATNNSFE